MLISFIFSYSENFFVVFYLSFYFVLGQDPSARDKCTDTICIYCLVEPAVATPLLYGIVHRDLSTLKGDCGYNKLCGGYDVASLLFP